MGRRRKDAPPDEPTIGHDGQPLGDNAKKQLAGYVEEIERIEAQKDELAGEIKDMYTSAKEAGFDVKALREVVRKRRKDKAELKAYEATVEAYRHALGDLADTPLGQAAIERAAAH